MKARPHIAVASFELALCLVLVGATGTRLHAQTAANAQAVRVAAQSDDRLAEVTLDTIAARLAALELRRSELNATGRAATHPDVVTVTRQATVLRQLLRELPRPAVAESYVNGVILRAVEARLASIAVERPLLAAERGASHPDVQVLAAEEAQLRQRRLELRAAGPQSGRSAPR